MSPFVESRVLERAHAACGVDYSTGCKDVDHSLCVPSEDHIDFIETLCESLVTYEPGAESDWSRAFGSHSERVFFERHLTSLLGDGVRLVEAQRPLSTMLKVSNEESNAFAEQRVDFALETPDGTKIVFEVDGPHHLHTGQEDLDQARDRELVDSGWTIERIRTCALQAQNFKFSSPVLNLIARDKSITSLNMRSDRSNNISLALQPDILTVTPHAVARVQLATLLAMMQGDLMLDATHWVIGVIERDMPCAAIALADLWDQLRNLADIYGIRSVPGIHVVTCAADPHAEPEEVQFFEGRDLYVSNITASGFEKEIDNLDILIDVSVRTRPSDVRNNDPVFQSWFRKVVPVYELRTAFRRAPEQYHHWPAPRSVSDTPNLDQLLTYFMQLIFRKPSFKA